MACRPTLWLKFGGREDLIRRMATASEASLAVGKPKRRLVHRLGRDDLERFARMVALLDTPGLPAAEEVRERSPWDRNASGNPVRGDMALPRVLPSSQVLPVYPKRARRKGVQGNVILRGVIHREGTVGDLRVAQVVGIDCGFEESAMQAVRQWRYEPGTIHGVPEDVYVDFDVEYVLR